jgi:hypothetical protein
MKKSDFYFGGEHSRKKEDLISAFDKIEERYLYFFKERPSKYDGDIHDSLKRHYTIYETPNKVTFAFNPDADLPESIKAECIDAFSRLFDPKNQ